MAQSIDFTELSLLSALDRRVELEPGKIWVSIPRDNDDLSKGFRDINYREFANAVEHAANWLDKALGSGDERIETIAYMGLNDLHPAILAAAAAKTGVKLLLPFPLAPGPAKRYLIRTADCGAVLFPAPLAASIEQLLEDVLAIKRVVVPTFDDWFGGSFAPRFESESAKMLDEPWLIFHTSGTTGMPKLITYTQRMFTSMSLAKSAIPTARKASMSLYWHSRVHVSIPFFHLVGLVCVLPAPIISGTQLVLGPTDRPPSGNTIEALLRYGKIEVLSTSPVWIRHLCTKPDGLALLKELKGISWAGTALDKSSGDSLCQYTQLSPSIGTTECGPYWTLITEEPKDWAYYEFIPGQGIEFDKIGDGLHELVVRRRSDAIWQQIFLLHPHLEEYRTSDVFKRHATKPNLWLYSGRIDDMFKLSNGWPIHYTAREQSIEENASVRTALIGAPGQTIPFLMIEAKDPSNVDLASIWQTVSIENQGHSEKVAIHEDMIILADPSRPFKRSAKDTILRKETFELYKIEIQQKLANRGHAWNILD